VCAAVTVLTLGRLNSTRVRHGTVNATKTQQGKTFAVV